MKKLIKQGSQTGLIFGIVLIFLILFGLTTTLSEIVGDFLKLNSNASASNTGGLMVLFALAGLWAGSRVDDAEKSDLKSALVFGISAGIVIGLFIGVFTLLIGFILTVVILKGLRQSHKRKFFRMGWDSWVVLVIYLVGIVGLYLLK